MLCQPMADDPMPDATDSPPTAVVEVFVAWDVSPMAKASTPFAIASLPMAVALSDCASAFSPTASDRTPCAVAR